MSILKTLKPFQKPAFSHCEPHLSETGLLKAVKGQGIDFSGVVWTVKSGLEEVARG